MKKRIMLSLLLSLLLIIVMTLPLSAAWGKKNTDKKVVVYTAHDMSIIQEAIPLCEKEMGMKVEYIRMGSGDIIQRAKAEKNKPQADVIWSIGGEELEANSDLLERYVPKEWSKVDSVYKVSNNWLPYTGIIMVLVVNTNLVPEKDMPKTWTDLGDAKWKGKISSARADKSGSAFMQLATVLNVHKNDGWSIYEKILSNFILSGSSGAISRLVNDGEMAIGITLEDNAYRFVKGGGPVKIIYPEDGTTVGPDGIALIKGAPHPKEAKMFIDWIMGKTHQTFISEKMARRSIRNDLPDAAGLQKIKNIKVVPYDFAWSAKNREGFIKKWTELVMKLGL